jgi:glycine hydroxymethyltransferase
MAVRPTDSWNACLNTTLEQEDKEIYDIVENEKLRQWSGLELIASEVCITWEMELESVLRQK